ncbi:MAG: hypothetical protein BRD48_03460 [Bacteroidetes bacterium QS_9_68_14]|nr:MAG: hypothetical protein BRD48_03460 [Bacteroidetes bacterium QS_9_68_14]
MPCRAPRQRSGGLLTTPRCSVLPSPRSPCHVAAPAPRPRLRSARPHRAGGGRRGPAGAGARGPGAGGHPRRGTFRGARAPHPDRRHGHRRGGRRGVGVVGPARTAA